MSAAVISHILDQHAEESAFLWILRDAAVCAPHYDLQDLIALEERIEAHIDGLRIAGDEGWRRCEEALHYQEAGEVFVAAVLAFESGRAERIQRVVEVATANEDTLRGLCSALGWLPWRLIEDWTHGLLQANHPLDRRIGLTACSLHRHDPGAILGQLIDDSQPLVKARALRLAGELKRHDLAVWIMRELDNPDRECRFRSAWSATLLGLDGGAEALQAFITPGSADLEPALQLLLRTLDPKQAQALLNRIAQEPALARAAVQGVGIIGDPVAVPWLIETMHQPTLARLAGEAFTLICGADLAELDLEGERPSGFESGPSENPQDEDVALDADEDLPWPDPDKVAHWWQYNQQHFNPGQRYLLGQPISVAHCYEILRTGCQRQREAAALELALLHPDQPLLAIRAPGRRQRTQSLELFSA